MRQRIDRCGGRTTSSVQGGYVILTPAYVYYEWMSSMDTLRTHIIKVMLIIALRVHLQYSTLQYKEAARQAVIRKRI
jgi:hypothetical protein